VGHLDDDVSAVGVEVPRERELVPRRHLPARPLADNDDGRGRLLLHAHGGRAGVVGENLLDLGRLVAAAGGDAVEPLGVPAGVVVQVEGVVRPADLQLVGDGAGGHGVERRLDRVEVVARLLEGVVPQRDLAGPQFLRLDPAEDAVLGPVAAADRLVNQVRRPRQVDVAIRRVAERHRVRPVGVLEVVVDALLFHQPAGEVEVGLAVLGAEVARLVGAAQAVGHVVPGEHLLEDVGDRELLEDAAAGLAGQEPDAGDEPRLVADEGRAPLRAADLAPLGEPRDHAVDDAGHSAGPADGDRRRLAEERGEVRDGRVRFREQAEGELEQPRQGLCAGARL
jgi:hypothetical protein